MVLSGWEQFKVKANFNHIGLTVHCIGPLYTEQFLYSWLCI